MESFLSMYQETYKYKVNEVEEDEQIEESSQ